MKRKLKFLILLFTVLTTHAQIDYDFSSLSGTYIALQNPTNTILTASFPGTKSILDESFANNILLGFDFQYNGENYSKIHLNSNGFASLGDIFISSSTINPLYEVNELRSATGFKGVIRPILSPFWDDLSLSTSSSISYKTEGVAPSRVFTAQWQNMIWQSGGASISFQIKLYETTNIIEFFYSQNSDAGGSNKSVSIGISSKDIPKLSYDEVSENFISLSNVSSLPTISRIIETDKIITKPIEGQVYKFTPKSCRIPAGTELVELTNNTAKIKWTSLAGVSSYNFVICDYKVTPSIWSSTNDSEVILNNLKPNTDYFFFLKTACSSIYRTFKFKTSISATLPYQEGFEKTVDTNLPLNMLREVKSNGFADVFWQSTSALTPVTGGTKALANGSTFVSAETWLYTPGFQFVAGKSYKLGFKYATTGGSQSLVIKFGEKVGAEQMSNALFSKTSITNTIYKDTLITFVPLHTGNYFVGFLYQSSPNNGVFLIDDISLVEVSFPCSDNPVLPNYAANTSIHVKANNYISASNKIFQDSDILYQAGKSITLLPGFEVKNTTVFKAQISGCD